jgi:molybdenum cofactor synthesis domain-containing protein
MKIMLVEDDNNMRSLLQTLLEFEGHQIVAYAGIQNENILEEVRKVNPHALILDNQLVHSSGIELLKELRRETSMTALPVMITSGRDLSAQAEAAGANKFLLKPYMPDELIGWLQTLDTQPGEVPQLQVRTAVLTISDRSYRDERPDSSGPQLVERINKLGWQAIFTRIIPDEISEISQELIRLCDQGYVDLILTTGGTGFSPRDITPEATLAVIDRSAPGLAEAMRTSSMKVTPHAMLSRAVAGIRRHTLIVNLPGSPKAAVENLDVIAPVIPHAIELLQSSPEAEQHHQTATD